MGGFPSVSKRAGVVLMLKSNHCCEILINLAAIEALCECCGVGVAGSAEQWSVNNGEPNPLLV